MKCTCGILKGRWLLLKTSVWIYGVNKVNQICFTCCTLHNWLLDIDNGGGGVGAGIANGIGGTVATVGKTTIN